MKKNFLFPFCFLFSILASNFTFAEANIGETVKDSDGNILLVNHEGATQYCMNQASRLPTIHEFAAYSISLGAKGIRETIYRDVSINEYRVEGEMRKNGEEGFAPLFRLNTTEEFVIDFYFSAEGYEARSPAPEDISRFWSSTVNPRQTDKRYAFDGKIGYVSSSYSIRYNKYAIRCVKL